MDFKEQIRQLDREVYDNIDKCSQKTIDIVEDIAMLINSEAHITSTELGALSYKLSTLLEVFNPELKLDISVLNRLYKIVEKWNVSKCLLESNLNQEG